MADVGEGLLPGSLFQVVVQRDFYQLLKAELGLPSQKAASLGRVAPQVIHLRGAQIARVQFRRGGTSLRPRSSGEVGEFAHGMGLAGRHHKVAWFAILQNAPRGLDVVAGVSPIALGVQVAKIKLSLQAQGDAGQRTCDFAGNEGFSSPLRFVIEKDAIGDK